MENYKGIYYHDSKEQRFYEGGAHFKYATLYKILLALGGIISSDQPEQEYDPAMANYKKEHIKSNKDIDSLLRKVEGKKSKYKTRNMNQLDYLNNPNTQIKMNSSNNTNTNLQKKTFLSKKDFCSRNINRDNGYFFDNNNNTNTHKYISSLSINNLHKNISNNLINILLNRKDETFKKAEEKTSRYNILNYTKFFHNRNRSELNENKNIIKAKNNSISNNNYSNNICCNSNTLRKFESVNKSYIKSLDWKIPINNINANISKDCKDYNDKNNKNNNFIQYTEENKGNVDNNITNNKNNDINKVNDDKKLVAKIQKKKYPLIYGKSKLFLKKDGLKLNSHSSFHKKYNVKKSRNVISNNVMGYNHISGNYNKTSNDINNNSYKKKYIKKYFFATKENNKDNSYIKKNDMNKNDMNKTLISNYNNITSVGNNIFKSFNIKNTEKVLKSNGNNFILKKYIRKKINQLCVFNNNNNNKNSIINGKIKNGNKINGNKTTKNNSNILFN